MIRVVLLSIIGALLTLYMIALLLRWLGPFIDFDLEEQRYLRWITKLTDPYIKKVKELMPGLGLVNLGPVAAVLSIWFLRLIIVGY